MTAETLRTKSPRFGMALLGMFLIANDCESQYCPSPPPPPVCGVTLYYRPVYKLGMAVGNHTFWLQEVFDGASFAPITQSVVDGGPSIPGCNGSAGCYVYAWENLGYVGHYPEDNPFTATPANSYGYDSATCGAAGAIDIFPAVWMALPPVPYVIVPFVYYVNSNTFAHRAGNFAGLNPPMPPDAKGW